MRVALYDVDSKIPNLALMRLSAFHKESGAEVVPYDPLFADSYDEIFASKVFNFSDGALLNPERMQIGGTGWDIASALPDGIDTCRPDYSFYSYPHSIGFTMRGCRFRCKFCVVPEKEGKPRSTATIEDIWQQRDSDFIVLLDNDPFGNPEWRDRFAEIRKHDLRVNFSQGVNIRIITDEQAKALAGVRFTNLNGTKKQVHFAWDQFGKGTERLIDEGIARCVAAGIKPWQMAFFVLIGFNTTPDEDMHRVVKLRALGCDPYVMPYRRDDAYQRQFARWVNHRAIFNSVPWTDYRQGIKQHSTDTRQTKLFEHREAVSG